MLADGDGAVRVVQNVVGHAAEDRATDRTQPTRPHHHHRHVLLQRRVHDRLARVLAELHHHPTAHLSTAAAPQPNNYTHLSATGAAGRTSPPCDRAPVNRRHNYQPVQTDPRDELTHSLFHSRLKTSFSANPSHRSPSFFSSWIHCTWIPQTEDCTVREKLLNMNFTEF